MNQQVQVMRLEVVTPESSLFSGEADAVVFPGAAGKFGVLNNHAPMIATLAGGRIKVTTSSGEELIDIGGGVVEVLNNKVIVLADLPAGDNV